MEPRIECTLEPIDDPTRDDNHGPTTPRQFEFFHFSGFFVAEVDFCILRPLWSYFFNLNGTVKAPIPDILCGVFWSVSFGFCLLVFLIKSILKLHCCGFLIKRRVYFFHFSPFEFLCWFSSVEQKTELFSSPFLMPLPPFFVSISLSPFPGIWGPICSGGGHLFWAGDFWLMPDCC